MDAPSSREEAGEVMRAAGAARRAVRIRGGGTKSTWGSPVEGSADDVTTERLDRIVEHNEGDLTAVFQAGVPLARAQEALAEADQMVALDPPLGVHQDGDGPRATVGGVIATGDSGPLRHRYGAPRDLILGITVALPDGTVATAGGKVIKNVAGYDLAKLFTGAFGTLGLIVEVVMRLHPRPRQTLTVVGRSDDPDALGAASSAVAHSPHAPDSLDVSWDSGLGEVMARVAGAAPEAGAGAVAQLMEQAALDMHVTEDDAALWDRQRGRQRSAHGAVVRVSGLASELPKVVQVAQEVGASLVGRAGLGLSWLAIDDDDPAELVSAIEEVRRRLQPFACVVLDAPGDVKEKIDVWGDVDAVPLMQRVKERFDPYRICNPGIFVGRI